MTKKKEEILSDEEKEIVEKAKEIPSSIESPSVYDNDEEVEKIKQEIEYVEPEEVSVPKVPEHIEPILMNISEIPGIGERTIEKLKGIGIINIADLAISSATNIHEKLASARYTRAFCEDLVIFAHEYLQKSGITNRPLITCKEMKNQKPRKRFSTGDENIDKWFGGGIESRAVTEFYGKFRSGKTQICYSAAVCTAAQGKKVLFIDTENTFDPMRVEEICKVRKYDLDMAEENILIQQPKAASLLFHDMQQLARHINENKIELVIVDSIIALHRAEFIGRSNLSDRQGQLSQIMSFLVRCAEHYDIAVMITNQVIDSPDPFKPGTFAAGGNIISHSSTHRVYMKSQGMSNSSSNKSNLSTMLMEDSPRYARTELTIQLGKFGVRWVDPSKPIPKD
jgi:DNA repair protein RadA